LTAAAARTPGLPENAIQAVEIEDGHGVDVPRGGVVVEGDELVAVVAVERDPFPARDLVHPCDSQAILEVPRAHHEQGVGGGSIQERERHPVGMEMPGGVVHGGVEGQIELVGDVGVGLIATGGHHPWMSLPPPATKSCLEADSRERARNSRDGFLHADGPGRHADPQGS
jgi:hypothetical protein